MKAFLIRVRFANELRVRDGRLTDGAGTEVHAAAFLRRQLIVLDRELLKDPAELRRIWLHELFHFVWWRLSNQKRFSWEQVLLAERSGGELGWSAQWRKEKLAARDRAWRTRRWREYCAESFCDTGAWVEAGMAAHPEATLRLNAAKARSQWWRGSIRYNPEVGH